MRRSLILLASILLAGPRRREKANHLRACKSITLTFLGALAAAAWGYNVSEARQSAPAPPSDLAVSFLTGAGSFQGYKATSPILGFTDNATNETGFVVQRCSGASCSSWAEIARLAPRAGETGQVYFWDNTGGISSTGQTLSYRVAAYNGSGTSSYSTYANFAMAGTSVPADASSVVGTVNGPYKVTVTFSHAVSTFTPGSFGNPQFEIERKPAGGSWEVIDEVATNVRTFADLTVEPSTSYQYRVRARNDQGVSANWATSASVTTYADAAPVASLSGTPTAAFVDEPIVVTASASTNVSDKPWETGLPYTIVVDGDTAHPINKREFSWAFRTAGSHTIDLTVKQSDGSTNSTQLTVTVSARTWTADAPHSCTAGESGGAVSRYHQCNTIATCQAALNAVKVQTGANPIVEIPAGTTLDGLLTLTRTSGSGVYGWLRSSAYASFTAEKRVHRTNDAAHFVTIRNPAGNTPAINVEGGTGSTYGRNWVVEGFKLTQNPANTVGSGVSTDQLVELGPTGLTTEAAQSRNFVLKHLWVTGIDYRYRTHRGIYVEAPYVSILDSIVEHCWFGNDSQNIYPHNQPGPIVVDNCLLSGATEPFFSGGGATQLPPDVIMSWTTLNRNTVEQPLSTYGDNNYTKNAGGDVTAAKNLIEWKYGRFILVRRNVLRNIWFGGQSGTPVLFTVTNQESDSPNHRIEHVQISDNVIKNIVTGGAAQCFQIITRTGTTALLWATPRVQQVQLTNNLCFDSSSHTGNTATHFLYEATGNAQPSKFLYAAHNTVLNTGQFYRLDTGQWFPEQGKATTGSFFVNNLGLWGGYAADAAGYYMENWGPYLAPGTKFSHNVMDGSALLTSQFDGLPFYSTLGFPATPGDYGFTNYASRDLRLTAGSTYSATGSAPASDGLQRGADISAIYTGVGGTSYGFGDDTTKAETGDWIGAPDSAFVRDTFTAADYTLVPDHSPEVGGNWSSPTGSGFGTSVIYQGRAYPDATSQMYNAATPPGADYSVQCGVAVVSTGNSASYAGVMARWDVDNANYYRARYDNGAGRWKLEKVIGGGVPTVLGSYVEALGAGAVRTVKLRVTGSQLEVFVDGVSRITASDSQLSAAGRVGFTSSQGSDSAGFHVDQFIAEGAAAGAPPAAPAGLTAVAASSDRINLSWADNSADESGFKVERCQGAGCANFAQVAQVGANVVGYSDTGLASDTSFSYRVRAFNAAGDSGYSATASATTFLLSDDFDDGTMDAARWEVGLVAPGLLDTTMTIGEVSGRLEIQAKPNASGNRYTGYLSENAYDLTGRAASVELIQPLVNDSQATAGLSMGTGDNARVTLYVSWGRLYIYREPGGASAYVAYDALSHRHIRLRHHAATDTFRADTSPDGQSWTEQPALTLARGGVTLVGARVDLNAGTQTSLPSPGAAVFDNFSLR